MDDEPKQERRPHRISSTTWITIALFALFLGLHLAIIILAFLESLRESRATSK